MSIDLAKLASLTVLWMDQTLSSELSATNIWVLLALEKGYESWSGYLFLNDSWPADKIFELVTPSDNWNSGLSRFSGIYLQKRLSSKQFLAAT
jgi:hypothetical protein